MIYIYIFIDLSLKPCLAVNPLGFCAPSHLWALVWGVSPGNRFGLWCLDGTGGWRVEKGRLCQEMCVCILVSHQGVCEFFLGPCWRKCHQNLQQKVPSDDGWFFCWWLRLTGCGWFCTWTWPMFEEFVKALPLLFLNWLAVATTIKCNLEATKWDRWGHQKFYETQGWCVPKSDPQGLKWSCCEFVVIVKAEQPTRSPNRFDAASFWENLIC